MTEVQNVVVTGMAVWAAWRARWCILALLLHGCGGGGGDAPAPVDPVDPVEPPDPVDNLFEIGGRLLVSSLTQVDADTADPGDTGFSARNNTLNSAQHLSNPAIVGGYLSGTAGTYPRLGGLYDYPADGLDIFRVNLLAGQRVALTVYPAADFPEAPLNTPLPAVDARIIAVADEQVIVETADIAADWQFDVETAGDYYIELGTTGDPATYTLVVGASLPLTQDAARVTTHGGQAPFPGAEFVPGEVIVTYQPQATTLVAATERPLPGYFTQRFDRTGRHGLLRLQTGMASKAFRARAGKTDASPRWSPAQTLQAIAELRKRPDIALAEPNYIRRRGTVEDNPLYAYQWHYPLINLPGAWEVPDASGFGVIVAVLDTGVLEDHPDLQGQLVAGYDFVSDVTQSLDGDGIDPDPTDPGDSPVGESSFHGTHVTGTIVAANNSAGGVGVAWDARVMPLRVLGKEGSGTDADLVQAIRFAAGLENASGTLPAQRADIINMSLGGAGQSQSLKSAVDAAVAAGVIVIAAAGNENSSQPSYPAAYPSAISVSAVGPDRTLAPYSNFGTTIDIAAPGGDMLQDLTGDGRLDGILSTWADDSAGSPLLTHALMQGTSMAAPHVAGVAALMASVGLARDTPLTPEAFRSYLENGQITTDLGTAGRDDSFGHGLVDAVKAIVAVDGQPFPTLGADVASLLFTQGGTAVVTLTIADNISGIVASASVGSAQQWLGLDDNEDDDPATYQVLVDAAGLELGVSYAGTIDFAYSASNGEESRDRTLTLRVTLALPDPDASNEAGRHYVLLDDGSSAVVPQTMADAVDGRYDFTITDVPLGTYLLVAGSDLDNDGLICDQGEACALYPVRSRPENLKIGMDLGDLEFTTGFLETFDTQVEGLMMSATRRHASAGFARRP